MRSNCSNKFRDTVSARNRNPRLAHQPFVVRVRDNILSQERFLSTHFSPFGGTDKGVQKAPLLVRTGGSAPAVGDMFAGTGDELPDVGFLQL
jgi:hypothetical protein